MMSGSSQVSCYPTQTRDWGEVEPRVVEAEEPGAGAAQPAMWQMEEGTQPQLPLLAKSLFPMTHHRTVDLQNPGHLLLLYSISPVKDDPSTPNFALRGLGPLDDSTQLFSLLRGNWNCSNWTGHATSSHH